MRVQGSRIVRTVCAGTWCYWLAAFLIILAVLIAALGPSTFTAVPDEQFGTTNGSGGVISGGNDQGQKPPGLGGR